MIVSNFQQNSSSPNRRHPPKTKKQYSAGFRYYNSHLILDKDQLKSTNPFSIQQYVDQLGVQNLTWFYKTSQSVQEQIPSQEYLHQMQYANKLYKNLYPKRRTNQQEQQQITQNQNEKFAQQVWDDDKKYQQRRVEKFLIEKQMNKIYKKISSIFTNKYKHKQKKLHAPATINQIFTAFLIENKEQLLSQKFRIKMKDGGQYEIIALFQGYINQYKTDKLIKVFSKLYIKQEQIRGLMKLSRFIWCFLQPFTKKQQEKQNKKLLYKFKQIKLPIQFNCSKIIDLMLDEKLQFPYDLVNQNYTKPLQVQFKKQTKDKKRKNQEDNQEIYVFKAKPIPKSTYKDPKQSQRPKAKTTLIKPFNLTEEQREKMTPQEYYHWQIQYKAKPIPQSTYRPDKIKLLSQQQKKAMAFMQLQKASYPKTMQYLNAYPAYKQETRQQISRKHRKQKISPQIHQIPDFNHLHAKQLINFETIKQKNKKSIQVKPFELSENRPKAHQQDIHQNIMLQRRKTPNFSNPKYQSKSTKKFDAYIKYRNDNQLKNKEKKQQIQSQNKKRIEKEKKLKQILKTRMGQQLDNHPIQHDPYNASSYPKMKVNYQKIYWERPLLMQSSLPKKDYYLPWQTVLPQQHHKNDQNKFFSKLNS